MEIHIILDINKMRKLHLQLYDYDDGHHYALKQSQQLAEKHYILKDFTIILV